MKADLDRLIQASYELSEFMEKLHRTLEVYRKCKTEEEFFWKAEAICQEELIDEALMFDDDQAEKFIGLAFQSFSVKDFEIKVDAADFMQKLVYHLEKNRARVIFTASNANGYDRYVRLSHVASSIVSFLFQMNDKKFHKKKYRRKISFTPPLKLK